MTSDKFTLWPRAKGHYLLGIAKGGVVVSRKDDATWIWQKGPNQAPDRIAMQKDSRAAFSGNLLATAAPEAIDLYELTPLRKSFTIQTGLQTHGDSASVSAALSPNGKYIAMSMDNWPKQRFRGMGNWQRDPNLSNQTPDVDKLLDFQLGLVRHTSGIQLGPMTLPEIAPHSQYWMSPTKG